ncbi:hypothetical protein SLS56_008241 [Neofusicoccum ribis]|uniref:Uncharacterized protein n=1 Tax=Neofusicoccum ribis TaxID=45134 RepID=A0ABR3SKP9_9PEZI
MALMGCKWNDLGRRIIEPRRFREDIVVLPFTDLPKILRGESEAEKLKTGSLGTIEEVYVETHGVAWLLWCFHAESSRMGEVYLAILRPFFEILQQIPQHSNPAVKRSVILQHSDEGFLVGGEPSMRETLCEVVQFIWFFCSSRTTYTPRWFWPLIERIEMDEEAVESMQALSYRSNLHWNLSVEMS